MTLKWRARKKILSVKDGNGEWIESEEGIMKELLRFYRNIFKDERSSRTESAEEFVRKVVTEEINEDLGKAVEDEDIRVAAFQLGALKAPGPDGFPRIFFQAYWDVLGSNISNAVKRFFETGVMSIDLNHTEIILVPEE